MLHRHVRNWSRCQLIEGLRIIHSWQNGFIICFTFEWVPCMFITLTYLYLSINLLKDWSPYIFLWCYYIFNLMWIFYFSIFLCWSLIYSVDSSIVLIFLCLCRSHSNYHVFLTLILLIIKKLLLFLLSKDLLLLF
jgi:hypothetical protein